jgi:hypothetical protein
MNTIKNFADGLTWEVERSTPYTRSVSGLYVPEEGYTALKRDDNGETLYITRKTYTETKNSTFMDYTQRLSEASGFAIEGYAEFDGGKKVLAYLRSTEDFMHKHLGLKTENYFVWGNSHDGSTPLFGGGVDFILRCSNQYGRIMKGLKIRHTKNHDFRVEEFIRLIASFKVEKEQEALMFQKMATIKIDSKILDSLANRLLKIDETKMKEGDILHPVTGRNKEALMNSFIKETSDLGMTLFGAFNGITHYSTHTKKSTDAYGNILGGNMKFNEQGLLICNEIAQEKGFVLV